MTIRGMPVLLSASAPEGVPGVILRQPSAVILTGQWSEMVTDRSPPGPSRLSLLTSTSTMETVFEHRARDRLRAVVRPTADQVRQRNLLEQHSDRHL
jgi:hypothetical protein